MSVFKKKCFNDSLSNIIKAINNNTANKGKVLCMRNFENKGVISGCLTGWLDNTLSEYGNKQAQYMSVNFISEIESLLLNNQTKLYASDLKRIEQSLKILFAYKDINYKTSSLLRDINYGEYEGYYFDGLDKETKKLITSPKYSFNNGESYLDVKFRSSVFLHKNYQFFLNNFNIIFSHNVFISSFSRIKEPLVNGDLLLVNIKPNSNNTIEISEVLKEYKTKYYRKNNLLSSEDKDYRYFNTLFNDYLDESIELDMSYRIPNLEELDEDIITDEEEISDKSSSLNNK